MLRLFGNLVLNLFRLPLLPVWWLSRLVSRPRATWVHVRLRGQLVEIERPVPPLVRFIPALQRARPTSLSVLRELADAIVEDPRIEGVLLEVPPLTGGWAVIGGLRAILVQLRKQGKKVVVFLPQGGGNREIYLARPHPTRPSRRWVSPRRAPTSRGCSIGSASRSRCIGAPSTSRPRKARCARP